MRKEKKEKQTDAEGTAGNAPKARRKEKNQMRRGLMPREQDAKIEIGDREWKDMKEEKEERGEGRKGEGKERKG